MFQEGTWSSDDKLEMRSRKGSTKNGTHLGRGGGSSCRQTRMTSECGLVRPHEHGMG